LRCQNLAQRWMNLDDFNHELPRTPDAGLQVWVKVVGDDEHGELLRMMLLLRIMMLMMLMMLMAMVMPVILLMVMVTPYP